MATLLEGHKRKRARAMQHFESLRQSVDRFVSRVRDAVAGDFADDAGTYIFRMPSEPAHHE
jgi:hypothetical protein